MDRALRNQAELERQGWRVLRFWESEIRRDLERVAREVALALEGVGQLIALPLVRQAMVE